MADQAVQTRTHTFTWGTTNLPYDGTLTGLATAAHTAGCRPSQEVTVDGHRYVMAHPRVVLTDGYRRRNDHPTATPDGVRMVLARESVEVIIRDAGTDTVDRFRCDQETADAIVKIYGLARGLCGSGAELRHT